MRNEKDEMIRATASPALLEEVEEIFDMAIREEWESVTTFGDAFDHVSDLSDQDEWRHLRTACRRVHIALGQYVAMTQQEIDNTVTNWGTVWAFKLGGVAYQWV